ncbi:hypothetical protein GOACH_11_00230 [Gordonia aichiensis NBRC 108223]|uniref:Uncharacterized protein n=1 Tax=Gordonia aichiensis NBRC 108223 TaxID=1220583 RepID=L7KND9_9ACTN|nr:hypothetical protein GOACH_11_00230 [Gordonia aichiensis NBRC 108223]
MPGIARTYTFGHVLGAADADPAKATPTPHTASTTDTAIPKSLRTDLPLHDYPPTTHRPWSDHVSVNRVAPIRQRRPAELL